MRLVDDVHGYELWVSDIETTFGYEWAVVLFSTCAHRDVDLGGYEDTFDKAYSTACNALAKEKDGRK